MRLTFQFDHLRNSEYAYNSDKFLDAPVFVLKNGINGNLKIRDLENHLCDDSTSRIEVRLQGFMRTDIDTCVRSSSQMNVTVEKEILSMIQSFNPQQHATIDGEVRKYAFRFDVRSWLAQNSQERPHHRLMAALQTNFLSIPPSLRHEIESKAQGTEKPRAGARVSYKLSARILLGRKAVARVDQPILLLFSGTAGPRPPICVSDWQGEYRTMNSALIKGSFRKSLGELHVQAQEPPQLMVKETGKTSMVEIPIKISLRGSKSSGFLQSAKFEAEVKWQFKFSTYVSMLEQRAPPTLKQALVSPVTALVHSSLPKRDILLKWDDWRPSYDDSGMVESDHILKLVFPREEVLTPTFWSPFLTRRYSIKLQIKTTFPGVSKVDIEVPIQVGLDTGIWFDSDMFDLERMPTNNSTYEETDGDELLPTYSRH